VRALQHAGEYRRALHLAVLLAHADDSDREGRELVAETCEGLVQMEPSFIARNFYRVAATQAREASS
jgi:alkyl sulfatase BDS1-like metallo-beta-lactamase superfamily hydrolase